jgi:hypothetical protein
MVQGKLDVHMHKNEMRLLSSHIKKSTQNGWKIWKSDIKCRTTRQKPREKAPGY